MSRTKKNKPGGARRAENKAAVGHANGLKVEVAGAGVEAKKFKVVAADVKKAIGRFDCMTCSCGVMQARLDFRSSPHIGFLECDNCEEKFQTEIESVTTDAQVYAKYKQASKLAAGEEEGGDNSSASNLITKVAINKAAIKLDKSSATAI